ncbi:MAG: flagellar biosynthesis protein FlhF, partial [Bacillota bacterium]|nr:flagellar biosynthesis protein FlhF [Bacillota bacterium]
ELGDDAVILNSKVIETGGFLGFFRKKSFEVIAAIDPLQKQDVKPIIKEKPKPASVSVPIPVYKPGNQTNELDAMLSKTDSDLPKLSDEILKEITELKSLLKSESFKPERAQHSYPEPIKQIQRLMEDQEISTKLQEHFLAELLEKWYLTGQRANKEEMMLFFHTKLNEFLSSMDFGGLSFSKKFVNVVGPTGVGKTTTLAKIAADCVIKYKKKVAFITTDTYRIGAIEQLKTYAKILNVPLEVCYNLDDFKEAKEKFEDFDLVLIDTAGRNFRNQQYVQDLQQIIDFSNEMETFLVLSLTAKQKDMEQIYQQFSLIRINKIIFTKADETSVYGSIINMLDKYKIGISYVTNGQNVPDDMMVASPEVIVKLLLGVV